MQLGLFILALEIALVSAALPAEDLYEAQAIVTGQREPERAGALPDCLEDVLVKVSGDPHLIGDARLLPLKAHAGDFVAAYHYHDRMSGLPVHDEQGTRDRPYDLTVRFDPEKIDAVLRSLGLVPWLERPRLAVFVRFEQGTGHFILTRDAQQGLGQRLALLAAAAKRGLVARLPSTSTLLRANLMDADPITQARSLLALTKDVGGDAALLGKLAWSESDVIWIGEWQLDGNDWRIHAATFDIAFRKGIEGSAQLLSGHGVPE